MKHIKLNKNWNADNTAPNPVISSIEEGIELSFLLDHAAYEHIDEGEFGEIAFSEVYAYKQHSTKDYESFKKRLGLKNDAVIWGDFYELQKSNWESDFSKDAAIVNAAIPKKQLRHFFVFLKNQVFEFLATEYKFNYKNNLEELLDEKYPKGYLNYYITMFTAHFDKPSIDNFKIYTDLYIQMRNKKEFLDLKNELNTIKKNDDLRLYLKYANRYEISGFGTKQLNEMVKVIETYKV